MQQEVKRARKEAIKQAGSQAWQQVTQEEVTEVIKQIKTNRRSLRFPREVIKVRAIRNQWCIWALVNMALSLATRSEDWLREISPIRKRGPVTVTSKENLRPISYVDDMQAVTEAAWLHQVKDKCWA